METRIGDVVLMVMMQAGRQATTADARTSHCSVIKHQRQRACNNRGGEHTLQDLCWAPMPTTQRCTRSQSSATRIQGRLWPRLRGQEKLGVIHRTYRFPSIKQISFDKTEALLALLAMELLFYCVLVLPLYSRTPHPCQPCCFETERPNAQAHARASEMLSQCSYKLLSMLFDECLLHLRF